MQVGLYIMFDGNCREAFEWYAGVFPGKILMVETFANNPDLPMATPEMLDKIMHARLQIGDNILMGSDNPGGNYQTPQSMFVQVSIREFSEARRIFGALSEGGTVTMAFDKTFWSEGFGMVTDRYNIPWMINCESE